ncbi:MAG TPA: LAGLIDADG family homing endonuclease [Ktedonobacteraceae bacterium]|nr:LAGLIDADG family homing endonuclease [Ktedonobacteraceae bacterium]
MDLVKRLEEYRDRERGLQWEGTFAQYFEIATKKTQVSRLSHERIYHMIMDAGVETNRAGDPRYNFFSEEIFGIEKPLQQIVEYFHSAAQRLEVRKRILLLMGPVGGGKSSIVYLLKRGLEAYSRSDEGAIYAIKDCPMHEEPLHLIPMELREEVEREFGLYVEGELCPHCRYMVDNHYRGRMEEVPVKRIAFSEKYRVGVGTFTPSDPKCVTGDTLVLTDRGLQSMEDIYLQLPQKPHEDEFVPYETTILGINGPERTAKFYCGGFQPIYEVETNLGYTIRGTANHPLLTLKPGGEAVWTKIGELRTGNYVALARGSRIFHGESAMLPESFYPLPRQPRTMTPDLAYWLGLLMAEGSVTPYETWFVNSSQNLISRFVDLTRELFGLEAVPHRKAETYNYNISISSKALSTWLRGELGIARGSHAKAVPACVLASSEADILAFLEGLFWGDATLRGDKTGSNTFKYTSKSRQLARQAHILLMNLGVVGSLWTHQDNGETYYNVTLRGDSVLDLVELIPSLRDKATAPLRETRSDKTNYNHFPHGSTLLNGHGGDGYLARIISGDRQLSYNRARTILAEKPELASTQLATLVKQDYLWLTVHEVRPAGIEPVYDLLVPETHSFVADGFVQHNSQDISELVGGIDLSTIGEVGVESDPRAYRFDGELNIANRGIMEFVEMLKCLEGNSLVFTQNGICRIDSFAQPGHAVGESRDIEFQLSTSTGVETTAQLYRAGLSKTKRIMTRRGLVQEGTHEHRTQVVNNDGVLVWKRLDQLQTGDWVVLQKGQNLWGQDVTFDWQPPDNKGARPLRIPECMTPALARWLGLLIAEGSINQSSIIFTNSEDEIRSDYMQLTQQIFNITPDQTPQRVHLNSSILVDFLKYLGFKTGAYDKDIPWSVLQSSRESMLEFLAGYFAGDGTVNLKGRLSWTTASETLAQQLQVVLLNLGVVTRRVMARSRAARDQEKKEYWTITAAGADADLLASQMRLLPQRKLLAYEKVSAGLQRAGRADCIPNTTGYWQTISQELQRVTIAQAQAGGGYHSTDHQGARQILGEDYTNLHMLRTGTNTCTREIAARVLGKLDGWVEPPPGLNTLLNASLFYDQVVAIEDGEAECWDLNVPGSNTFIANGFVNHNCDEKFLYVLLTLSQEQNIKTGRFSMIYADEVVVSHTNEHEYQSFVGNKKSEALQDRIILVKVPYNLRVSDEIKIYEKLLKQSSLQNVHIAPYTLRIASIFAVLTRLEPSKKAGMSTMKKLKLYDGEDMEDFKQKDVRELQEEAQREGMDGISPRYVINRLSSALVKQNTTCINPIDALRALRDGLDQHTSISREERERYLNFISEARKEYDEMAKKEVQRAFVYSYEESARTLLNNYLDNVEAYCNKNKLRDPITDEELDPDEQLMRSIEEQIGVSETAKKSFREEILIRISSLARKGLTFDYTSHERLKEAIEKKLFADLRDVVKITTSTRTPDAEQLRKINDVVNRLMSEHGYCHVCANEILRYTGSLLNR